MIIITIFLSLFCVYCLLCKTWCRTRAKKMPTAIDYIKKSVQESTTWRFVCRKKLLLFRESVASVWHGSVAFFALISHPSTSPTKYYKIKKFVIEFTHIQRQNGQGKEKKINLSSFIIISIICKIKYYHLSQAPIFQLFFGHIETHVLSVWPHFTLFVRNTKYPPLFCGKHVDVSFL